MEKSHTQSFEKGISRDFNTENSNGGYYSCENFRINSIEGGSMFLGLTNDISNEFSVELPSGQSIIGTCNVRDIIVIFATDNNTEAGGQGWIYTLEISKDANEPTLTLKYTNNELQFSILRPITALGIHEDSKYTRVYFSDYLTSSKCINLTTVNIIDSIDSISMFPQVDLRSPFIDEIFVGGNLKVGIYEYFYYLSTNDGKDTLYSPNSTQIHIVEDNDSLSNDSQYYGSAQIITVTGEEQVVNKAVRIIVLPENIPANTFSKVTLGVIYKTGINELPVVQTIETKDFIDNTSILFTHSGLENTAITLTYENFLLNSHPFYTNKCFAIKDNALVVSNVKSQTLDLDWETECFRWKNDGSQLTAHDSYKNPFNDETGSAFGTRPLGVYQDWLLLDQYQFQSDGVTLGGESLDQSIKYKFTLEEVGTDVSNTDNHYWSENSSPDPTIIVNGQVIENKSFNSFASPFIRSLKGYKREEVYRFGIVGKQGSNYSFVKYIGDIKFPSISDVANYETAAGTGINNFPISILNGTSVTTLFSLGIEFTIEVPSDVIIDSYEIVRVSRTELDKTRFCSGVISRYFRPQGTNPNDVYAQYRVMEDIPGYYDIVGGQANSAQRDFFSFFTPEASYKYNYPTAVNGAKLKVTGYYTSTTKVDVPSGTLGAWGSGFTGEIRTKARVTDPVVNNNAEYNLEPIKAFQFQEPGYGGDAEGFSIEGINYRQYSSNDDQLSVAKSYSGQALTVKLDTTNVTCFDDSTPIYGSGFVGKAFLLDFVLFKQDQYGGTGEESVSYNNFISVTNSIKNNGPNVTRVFNGDIYVCWYEFLKRFWDTTQGSATGDSVYEAVIIPIETTVNINLNINKTLTKGQTGSTGNTSGNWLTQEQDTFNYNQVFSSDLLTRSYAAKPISFTEQNTFDVRSYLSLTKIMGESTDSWTKFPTNAFFDIKANNGPINCTFDYLNNIFFLQDNGVGYISINPRVTLNDESGVPTKLGSSAGFERYVYISENSGCIHQWAAKVIDSGLYYYDAYRKVFNRLNGTSVEGLSSVKGMDSFFGNLGGNIMLTKEKGGDNPLIGKGIHLGYNQAYEELYITLHGNFVIATNDIFGSKGIFPTGSIIQNGVNYYQLTAPVDFGAYFLATEQLEALYNNSIVFNNKALSKTVVFNTSFEIFSAFYGFKPSIYLHDFTNILSPDPDNPNKIYLHNLGTNCIFYDNSPTESSLEFYVSDLPTLTKVIKFINYDIIAKNAIGTTQNEGLSSIRVSDDYQDSGIVSLSGRQRNRFNTWKIQKIPRNASQPGKISRIRNDWFKVSLFYDNSLGNTVNLERIFTTYFIQP